MASWAMQSVKRNGQSKVSFLVFFFFFSLLLPTEWPNIQGINLLLASFPFHSKWVVRIWGCSWFHLSYHLSNIFLLGTLNVYHLFENMRRDSPNLLLSLNYWTTPRNCLVASSFILSLISLSLDNAQKANFQYPGIEPTYKNKSSGPACSSPKHRCLCMPATQSWLVNEESISVHLSPFLCSKHLPLKDMMQNQDISDMGEQMNPEIKDIEDII